MAHAQSRGDEAVADLIVVGAGAGGMTAALVASLQGLRVVLCEATDQVGGTTATSAGTLWIPGNRQGVAAGHGDTVDAARRYLEELLGPEDERGLRQAFFDTADEAIHYLEQHSELRFASAGKHPDYLPRPGAAVSGRALAPLPFDGRQLGADFARVRPPLPDFMVLGGMMAGKADVLALIDRYRSWSSFVHTAKLILRYGRDRLRYRRGTRLVMGNALVARLYYSLRQAGVDIRYEHRLRELVREAESIGGAVFDTLEGPRTLRARLGVVLATGGVGHGAELRSTLAGAQAGFDCLMAEAVRGEGITVAYRLGAGLERHPGNFFWQPVSRVPATDAQSGGGHRLFPHLYLDRTKPGIIAVDAAGRRFVNEADSYHHFVEAMLRRGEDGASALPCYLICDAWFVRKYGLGVIPPGTRKLDAWVRSGYVVADATLAGLARRIGIDGDGLVASVARNNDDARTGKDTWFGKGDSELNLLNGDPSHSPNPCLGPIETGPFYALAVWPADSGNSAGLATDADGRVLDGGGLPIPGLYACGNDMASIMRGAYPGPGITLGPAMVFGYRIARHVASMHTQRAAA